YMFVYSPALIMEGPRLSVAVAIVTAIVGVIFLTAALTGYLLVPCKWHERALLLAAALVLIKPGVISDVFGLVVAVIAVRSQLARRRRSATGAAEPRVRSPG
ncbi:MAG TPA: DUF3394 domain-containing protein, partial [Candidatus Limnocylindria bacterium]|nr:DUF3394 domain-containing protein [Candidatus Limnocylindria bacterium]